MLNKSVGFLNLLFWGFAVCPPLMAQEPEQKAKVDWFGYIGSDFRYFPATASYEKQHKSYFSSVFKPQFLFQSASGKHQINFIGFARIDQHDNKRTHADIRDLYWQFNSRKWEVSAGMKTVSWGKTESNHLVDIINQHDLVEGRDLENKLGQPLIQIGYKSKGAIIEFYLTSVLRKLQFPGTNGRLRPDFPIDSHNPEYSKKNGSYIPDIAVRFENSVQGLDIALSNFQGTNRLPFFKASAFNGYKLVYEEINQTGVELQWLKGRFAFKAEAIHQYQFSRKRTIQATTVGVEYNSYFKNGRELKYMLEYSYDERDGEQISGINNDLFAGLQLNLNDRQSTNFMVGSLVDAKYGTAILRAHAERRLAEAWKINLEYNGILKAAPRDFYYLMRNDSFLEIGLVHYFAK